MFHVPTTMEGILLLRVVLATESGFGFYKSYICMVLNTQGNQLRMHSWVYNLQLIYVIRHVQYRFSMCTVQLLLSHGFDDLYQSNVNKSKKNLEPKSVW